MIIRGRDTSRKSKHPTRDSVLYYTIKLLSSALPIVAALFVSNLIYVLKYAGITGFFICFLFPTSLQLRSIWICSREFGPQQAPMVEMKKIGGNLSTLKEVKKEEEEKGEDGKEEKKEISKKKSSSCCSFRERLLQMFSSYQTPFSNRFLSHPIVVALIGGLGILLLLLGVSSLGVHPEPIYCSDEP